MRALVEKEIRLLLPAFGAALLLAIVPVWLESRQYNPLATASLYPVCLAALLLAMSTFGREFGLSTFSLMLAQPLERRQIWRVKIAALATALALVVAVWSFCCVAWLHDWMGRPTWQPIVPLGVAFCAAIFAGGLWTTLLLRQVAAAFWLTALIPAGVATLIAPDSRFAALFYVVLGLYSIGGIILAWWQFFHAQEVGWTGGTVTLTGWRSAASSLSEQSVDRRHRPLAALLRKELQLNRGGLLAMGAFFVVHVCAVLLREKIPAEGHGDLREALEFIGGLWVLAPLFLVGPGVAEERRLGTLDIQLCQPVSSRLQFVVKLLFSLVVGGLLCALLLWTAEGIGSTQGVLGGLWGLKTPFDALVLLRLSTIFLGLSLAGFLASTLARGTIQAMATAPAVVFVVLVMDALPFFLMGPWAERLMGSLLPLVLWPSLVVVLLRCAWKNFRSTAMGWQSWRRNLLSYAGALVFALVFSTAVHNRLWEFLTPLESAHGTARLPVAGARDVKPSRYVGGVLTLVLPGGRAWVSDSANNSPVDPGEWQFSPPVVSGPDASGNGFFLEGSNWVDLVENGSGVVAIRADGTLWVSENPATPRNQNNPLKVVQYGDASDWKSVTYGVVAPLVLLKQDGTLWQWAGQAPVQGRQPRPDVQTYGPRRLGTNSDWSRVLYNPPLHNYPGLFAWKNDGTAWVLYGLREYAKIPSQAVVVGRVVMERRPVLDNFNLRSLTSLGWQAIVGVRDDGTLWVWNYAPPQESAHTEASSLVAPQQVGTGADWRLVAAGFSSGLTALKADGSLWKIPFQQNEGNPASRGQRKTFGRPTQVGSHKDWVAIDDAEAWYGGGFRALAADGSLWYWTERNSYFGWYRGTLLAPPRKPVFIGNVFAETK